MRRLAAEGVDFRKFEGKRAWAKTKRGATEAVLEPGPHPILLPKGAAPEFVKLTPYQQFSWQFMRHFVRRRRKATPDLEDNLLKAHMRLRPEEYLATAYMSLLFIVIGAVIGAVVLSVLGLLLRLDVLVILILVALVGIVPPLLGYAAFFGLPVGFRGIPASTARKRARRIDARISSAMSFISAMASAEVPVDVIFRELSRQPVYGEIQKEAEWITRDTELLGVDILTAIRNAGGRTPSTKFQDFLQGVVTTSTSGGQLKPYFVMKAEQFQKEDRLEMRKKMESLGLLAEAFVTVVVAFPLFLVVIMAIMALISKGSSGFIITLLFAIVGMMIPLSQFGFIFAVWNMEQEA